MYGRLARFLALSPLLHLIAFAQPVTRALSPAVNSASYRAAGMAGTGVAQGSMFTIFGTGLGPQTLVQAFTFPLPTNLGGSNGTSVTVTVGGTQVSAIILAAINYQVNAILPSTTPVGTGTFTVTYQGQTSAPAPIQVVASAFGIYTFNSSGSGQAIATDLNYSLNTIIHTFHPGDYVTLWGTGLGAISGSDADVPPTGNVGSIVVHVGNTTASQVPYHGRSGFAGLDQIDFQVPAGVTGCYVPVAVEAGGIAGNIGNITTIAVSDSGNTCTDSIIGQDMITKLVAGQNVNFGLIRLESSFEQTKSYEFFTGGFAMATFSSFTPATAGLAEYGISNGYCVAVDCSNGCATNSYNETLTDSSPAQLDAGAVSMQRGTPIPLTQSGGYYWATLTEPDGSQYLNPALTYPISGAGGTNVGAFSASDTTSVASAFLTGLTVNQTVSVAGDLTLNWRGGNPALQNGQVTIGAISADSTNFTRVAFLQCTAPVATQTFTIPGWVLASLPPTGSLTFAGVDYPLGWIWIGQYNNPTPFTAPGLDKGLITDIFNNGYGVYFQ